VLTCQVEPLLRQLELASLLKDLKKLQGLLGGAAPPSTELQAALSDALATLAGSCWPLPGAPDEEEHEQLLVVEASDSSSGSGGSSSGSAPVLPEPLRRRSQRTST
jgi:hypothetical protein